MDPTPNLYDVGEVITLKVLFLAGATLGSIRQGASVVYVRDPTGLTLTVGAPIVVADAGYAGGDLRTTVVSSSGGAITLADSAKQDANLVRVGSPFDPPSPTCKVAKPDGSEQTLTPASSLTGLWTAPFTPTLDGDHYYRFSGGSADGWRKFRVRPERVP